ncbi:nucleoside 2-deoxyribosyltransferase [Chlamydiia bacterium]|nr:nucleoside 2-deoxyribosyltransferase [Chlamydiia bacterium]
MSVKFYFSGSISGGRQHEKTYKHIVSILNEYGEVLTEHVAYGGSRVGQYLDSEVFARDMAWLEQAQILVADVSQPSVGVGFEIASAIERGITVVALYDMGARHRLSSMISGCPSVILFRYSSIEELSDSLRNVVESHVDAVNELVQV